MKINESMQYVINENDAIQALLSDMKINEIVTDDMNWVNKFNSYSNLFDFNYEINAEKPAQDKEKYIQNCINEWHMPDEYKNMNIEQFLFDKCKNKEEKERVKYELSLFKQRNLYNLLKFLCYFVDTANQNNIILGVGRGSSVSSYVLYLIGIHKINSLEYDLDIKEFLK